MVDQVTTMQRDVEILQSELVTATERYDVQVRKYNERKQRTKNKLQKARYIDILSEHPKLTLVKKIELFIYIKIFK